jgi:hypothetical protein
VALFSRREDENEPWWPTSVRSQKHDGRIIGTDGSVWLYAKVPLSPVTDARSPAEALAAGAQIQSVLEEITATTQVRMARRSVSKSAYRNVHLLLVNIPAPFVPPADSQLFSYLSSSFTDADVLRRVLLVGVRLQDKVGGARGWRSTYDSVVETLTTGTTPIEDFDHDFAAMSAVMARAGLHSMTDQDFALANAWWNEGKAPDTPMLVHDDHLHVFTSTGSMQAAARLIERDHNEDCRSWELTKHHTLCFACVRDFTFGYPDATSRDAQWASTLIESGAVCISIRGRLEPAKITRSELRRGLKKYNDDIKERREQGKMSRAEQEELQAELIELEGHYATGGPATLTDCSTIVVSSGSHGQSGYDMSEFAPGALVELNTMTSRQNAALAETWLASPVRANPYLHDLPTIALAASGLAGLSTVGDRDGALLGFTENDRQPAYISPTAAADEDSLQIAVVVGQSGSGKSVSMLYLADQFARITTANGEKTPVLIIDPKMGSDHSAVIQAGGGSVSSLDDLLTADGVFDPLRFSKLRGSGAELAASMLVSINPWGDDVRNYEMPVQRAIAYGVDKGADCIGVALKIALDDGIAPERMVAAVLDLAKSSPMFRACVGSTNGGQSLRASEGITLIKVGDAHLDLPPPGQHVSEVNLNQRIALALVRMMVFGSASALAMRSGVLMLDEAWVMLGAGRSEMERLGRLARSQQVFPILFTQRVTDALDAGLSGYISRGIILPIQDVDEATAACELFKLEPTPERMERLTAKSTLGASGTELGTAPNWSSMRALRDPITGKVLRGAIGIYVDLAGRAVPVEIRLPDAFLKLSSTNPDDIRRRLAEQNAGLSTS